MNILFIVGWVFFGLGELLGALTAWDATHPNSRPEWRHAIQWFVAVVGVGVGGTLIGLGWPWPLR